MKLKSRTISLLLTVAASIFMVIVGCGGGGGGGGSDIPFVPGPTDADLSLTKTVNIATPDVDTDVVFTITVSNAGPSNATGVVVTDKIPTGYTYRSDDGGGTYNATTGAWSVGTVAVSGSQTLNITATVKNAGNYTNTAEVTAANEPDPNSTPGNGFPNENDFASVAAPPPSINVKINQVQLDCSTSPGSTNVAAFVTVIDQIGDPVTTLNNLTFTLTENQGSPPYTVDFAEQIPIPLSVAIALDYSGSIFDSGIISEVEDAAIIFINQLSAVDRGEIIKFSKTVQVIAAFTDDKDILRDAVIQPFLPLTNTELYDAIIKGILDTAAEPNENRKGVLVVTDGRNKSAGTTTIGDVIRVAQNNGIPVFPIGIGAAIDVDDLSLLADETGGIFYQSTDIKTLEEIYQQLADSLVINQFVFEYTSLLGIGQTATLSIGAEYNGLIDSDTRNYTTCP
jgi:VWFA-related protein